MLLVCCPWKVRSASSPQDTNNAHKACRHLLLLRVLFLAAILSLALSLYGRLWEFRSHHRRTPWRRSNYKERAGPKWEKGGGELGVGGEFSSLVVVGCGGGGVSDTPHTVCALGGKNTCQKKGEKALPLKSVLLCAPLIVLAGGRRMEEAEEEHANKTGVEHVCVRE